MLACSLDAADHERRVQHWRRVLAAVVERVVIAGGVSLTLRRRTRPAEPAAAEVACCPFLELMLHLGPPLRLDARAPAEALALVDELFGGHDATA